MYKIRVILDTPEDVIRTILVDRSINLESLHLTIAKAFGFDGMEVCDPCMLGLASFTPG